ncbi:response regulator [Legionella spiritensis]|uniref:Two component response regulator n=1 Tax=Legionella spiritensis TaxID=452 RepID=A0A0W0Z5B9_LEGSP|nr:response regulator [Legionella spiritensis]KTD64352.1 Two component response regulator [Legionella spiritensis]SNV46382.1 Response regulator containing a CheY-like receiver domain and an HD-GYP domain [Legionella spiritensis]
MPHHSIPACYFPSTALFVDDSRDFLLNFVLQLDEDLAYKIFDSPVDALDCINRKRCEFEMLNQRCESELCEARRRPLANSVVNLNLAAIHAEIYNPRRFSEISVVVVDYAMPGMDGIEFCRRLADTSIKKILLTGQADEKIAIEAFNEGLIHRYIHKNDPDSAELITRSIRELQWQYFQAMSDMIVRMLSVTPPNCLYDRVFIDFFHQLRAEKRVVEYYLADSGGSFLLLDDDAKVSFLIVKNKAELESQCALARAKGASDEVLNQLLAGEKMLCFWQDDCLNSDNGLTAEWNSWENCLVSANRLQGENTYYYAYIHGPVLFDVRQDKILSYHRHLDDVDAEELLLA